MTREQVHDLMENELRCVQRGNYCDRDCAKCPLVKDDKELIEAYGYVIKALEQEPRKGHWITQWNPAHQKEYYYCSECREEYSYDGETGIKMNDYNFCPNCGSDNREVEE